MYEQRVTNCIESSKIEIRNLHNVQLNSQSAHFIQCTLLSVSIFFSMLFSSFQDFIFVPFFRPDSIPEVLLHPMYDLGPSFRLQASLRRHLLPKTSDPLFSKFVFFVVSTNLSSNKTNLDHLLPFARRRRRANSSGNRKAPTNSSSRRHPRTRDKTASRKSSFAPLTGYSVQAPVRLWPSLSWLQSSLLWLTMASSASSPTFSSFSWCRHNLTRHLENLSATRFKTSAEAEAKGGNASSWTGNVFGRKIVSS